MPESTEEERINVELKSGERIAFDNFDEAKAFAESEREYWSWLQQAAAQHSQLNGPWKQLKSQLTQIGTHVDQYRASKDATQQQQLRDRVKAFIEALAGGEFWLWSANPRAKYVKKLSEQDLGIASFCYLWFVQPMNFPASEPKALQGMLHGWMFLNALPADRADSEKQALEEVRGLWDRFSGTSKDEYSAFRAEFGDLKREIAELRIEQAEKFAGVLSEGTEKLQAIATTYDEKLALQQPVTYWSDRAKKHRNLSIGYSMAFGIGAVLVVAGVAWASTIVVPELWKPELLTNADGTVRELPYWRILVLAIFGGFFVWPVRILSRVLLSNLHLWTDAEERVTMANTYLSLLRSEAGLEESDRKLILEALFRAATTGIVREDAMGPGTTAVLSRIVGGR